MKRKKFAYRAGDVFAIPVAEGIYGLGHIVDVPEGRSYQATCALFAECGSTPAEVIHKLGDAPAPVAILVVGDEDLETGRWPILAHWHRDYSGYPRSPYTRGVCFGQGNVESFLAAYHGFEFWDGSGDPKYHEKILLPGCSLPSTVRYKHDLTRGQLGDFQAKSPSQGKPRPPITDGPALVTIQLTYPGSGLPSTDLLRKRQELERRLEAAGAGEIEGAESGAGVMEIVLRTDDVRRAMPLVEKIAGELGFTDDMLIETAAVNEEEDDQA